MLCFLPWDTLQALYWSFLLLLLVYGSLCIHFFIAVSEKHGLSGLGQVNWLPIKEYAFICLEKLLSAFRSWLWVIINLHSELLSNQFCSISLNRENSLVNAKIHPAASISCHIINKYVDPILLTTMHPHCLHYVWQMMWCCDTGHKLFLSFQYFSLPINLVQINRG